jgi:hypothetical protein
MNVRPVPPVTIFERSFKSFVLYDQKCPLLCPLRPAGSRRISNWSSSPELVSQMPQCVAMCYAGFGKQFETKRRNKCSARNTRASSDNFTTALNVQRHSTTGWRKAVMKVMESCDTHVTVSHLACVCVCARARVRTETLVHFPLPSFDLTWAQRILNQPVQIDGTRRRAPMNELCTWSFFLLLQWTEVLPLQLRPLMGPMPIPHVMS